MKAEKGELVVAQFDTDGSKAVQFLQEQPVEVTSVADPDDHAGLHQVAVDQDVGRHVTVLLGHFLHGVDDASVRVVSGVGVGQVDQHGVLGKNGGAEQQGGDE